jgi:hypothetical protein
VRILRLAPIIFLRIPLLEQTSLDSCTMKNIFKILMNSILIDGVKKALIQLNHTAIFLFLLVPRAALENIWL